MTDKLDDIRRASIDAGAKAAQEQRQVRIIVQPRRMGKTYIQQQLKDRLKKS